MAKNATPEIEVPSSYNWRTSDQDEINRRRARAQSEAFRIANTDARHPIFSNFRVQSGSGLSYSVEVRDLGQRQFAYRFALSTGLWRALPAHPCLSSG